MPEKQIRVVVIVIDEHGLVHEAVNSLIEGRENMVLVGAETSATRGCQLIAEAKPDVAILEISPAEMNGLTLAGWIVAEHPDTSVVMLTMHEDRAYVQRALELGVKAYVSKRSSGDHLLSGIAAAAEGGVCIDPVVAQKLLVNGSSPISRNALYMANAGPRLTER